MNQEAANQTPNEVTLMEDFIKAENERRRGGGQRPQRGEIATPQEPMETLPVGESPAPLLSAIYFNDGEVRLTGGVHFKLPDDFLKQIVGLCLRAYELHTIQQIKDMAERHGLKVAEAPPPPEEEPTPAPPRRKTFRK